MKGIILVLGAPNSNTGELSEIARNRLDGTIKFYHNNPEFNIICTGGFGQHFNTTDTPHAEYAIRYLLKNQIPESAILEYVLSSNTMEDALHAKPIIDKYKPRNIVVITSDFHMKRVRLIFNHHFLHENLLFVEALSTVETSVLAALAEHEKQAIQRLKFNF